VSHPSLGRRPTYYLPYLTWSRLGSLFGERPYGCLAPLSVSGTAICALLGLRPRRCLLFIEKPRPVRPLPRRVHIYSRPHFFPPPPPPCPPRPTSPPTHLNPLFSPPPPLSVAVESLVPTRKCLVLPALRTAANGVSGAQSGRAGSPEVAVAVAIAASLASIRCSLPCCHTAAILSLAERLRRARPQRPQRGRPRDPKRPKRPSHGTIEGKSPGISAANLQARRHWDMYLVLYMPSRSTPPPLLLSILIPPLPCTQWTTRRGHVLAPALGPHPAQAKEGRQAPL